MVMVLSTYRCSVRDSLEDLHNLGVGEMGYGFTVYTYQQLSTLQSEALEKSLKKAKLQDVA